MKILISHCNSRWSNRCRVLAIFLELMFYVKYTAEFNSVPWVRFYLINKRGFGLTYEEGTTVSFSARLDDKFIAEISDCPISRCFCSYQGGSRETYIVNRRAEKTGFYAFRHRCKLRRQCLPLSLNILMTRQPLGLFKLSTIFQLKYIYDRPWPFRP